jgi:hypothetical protein
MGACRRLPQHAVQPEPAGLRGRREVLILVDVRGEQLQRDGGRRRDHVGRRGRRVRQEDPTQTVASICTCAELVHEGGTHARNLRLNTDPEEKDLVEIGGPSCRRLDAAAFLSSAICKKKGDRYLLVALYSS